MTEQELAAIDAKAHRIMDNLYRPREEWSLIRKDVPALVAEVRRLQALLRRSAVVS